ncbi:energy transducer TonB [Sphingomicrobium sediminis]|uniref:Energy transducer TonB n=1 Tax=Sphingomicrobium sediminis TaxID=2950949 RepID=A0A9X2J3Z4_9SPHN|nr:energy transducer TonB [Sphingomicrobium sediminis]MCM8557816.1 energy transducer TonB [Sphingomicrobium sediminis]
MISIVSLVAASLAAQPAADDGRKPVVLVSLGHVERGSDARYPRIPENWIRRAVADKTIYDLFDEDGPLVTMQLTRKLHNTGGFDLLLDIAADGTLSCALDPESQAKRAGEMSAQDIADIACGELMQSSPWMPALTEGGERVASTARMSIGFAYRRPWSEREENGYVSYFISPAPPAPPPPTLATIEWLPRSSGTKLQIEGLDLAQGVAPETVAEDEKGWAGLAAYLDEAGTLSCRVVRPSGSRRFDEAACDEVREATGIQPETRWAWHRYAMLIALPGEDGPQFLTQSQDGYRIGRPSEQGLALAAAEVEAAGGDWERIAVRGGIRENGQVSSCFVMQSSGTDAGDLAACRVLSSHPDMMVARRDLFGFPMAGYYRYFADGVDDQ